MNKTLNLMRYIDSRKLSHVGQIIIGASSSRDPLPPAAFTYAPHSQLTSAQHAQLGEVIA